MKLTKSQIKELIRHSIRELTSEREDVTESKKRRFTVKEVRMWMKKLEENRYKKVYNSDARRVAWMVNNEGRTLDEMPMSMKKKWSKAQYGRERYLATEFLKSKSEQLSEGLDIRKLENAIMLYKKAIKKQGRVTNARDEDHLKQLGIPQKNGCYFDTLHIEVDSKTLQKIALENEINLFYPDANSAALSLNEATTREDFDRLVHVFETYADQKTNSTTNKTEE